MQLTSWNILLLSTLSNKGEAVGLFVDILGKQDSEKKQETMEKPHGQIQEHVAAS